VPPQQLSHYRIVGQLGRGAMGEVYRAVDQRLGREVALKVLPREVEGDAGWQARLLREAQAASALNHPGIVTLHDIGSADGRTFLVMELVDGEPAGRLARRGVTWRRALTIVADVAEALAAAHALGILHRDIKSDNLMVLPGGQVKVLDFGLAKAMIASEDAAPAMVGALPAPTDPIAATVRPGGDLAATWAGDHDAPSVPAAVPAGSVPAAAGAPLAAASAWSSTSDVGLAATMAPPPSQPSASGLAGSQPSGRGPSLASDLTVAGTMVGTPAYMAPESYEGVTDVRSEVFSLGVVLYELLVGARPFDRGTPIATQAAIQLDEPVAPSAVAPDRAIPAAVDAVALRALAKEPSVRFPDMTTFAAAVRALAAPAVAAPPPTAPPRSRAPLIAIGFAAAGVVAAATWWLTRPPAGDAVPAIAVTSSRRLTLEPGCEDYPRFTPDGARVIYDGVIDGDYEVLSIALDGSDRRRLTRAPGWDYAAAVSPDGARFAYVHEAAGGRTAMLAAIDGAAPPRSLGPIAGYPSWTADGALLVADDAAQILRWDLAADPAAPPRATVLGRLPTGARPYHLAAVADDGVAVLWWTSSDADTSALGELDRRGRLRVVEESATDYEGGLAAAAGGHGYYVTRKAATTGNELWWRRWGRATTVVVPGGLSPRAGLSVAPDGRHLVFSTCIQRQSLVRLRPDGSTVPLPHGEWQDTSPGPAGRGAVLFTSDRQGQRQGWLADLASGEARAVTPPDTTNARASIDGTQLVYTAGGGRGGLAVVAAAGGAPRALTTDATDGGPSFTFDGAAVVFVRTLADGSTVIHRVPTAGGAARALTAGIDPATSPLDGTIAFLGAADASGARPLLLTDGDGAPPRPVPGVEPADWHQPRFSPDGTRLLLVRSYQQVVEVTLDGSAPPRIWWSSPLDAIMSADWAPDGDGALAARAAYDGDLWLATGRF